MGFSSYIQPNQLEDHTLYPHTTFELTPNMVSGLLNTTYDNVGTADSLPGTSCANPGIQPPKKLDPCPAMEALNSVSGFLPEEEYTTYVRSDNAGVTDELFKWLCAAPDHTVPLGKKSDPETYTAAQILGSTNWENPSLDGTCPDTDQFPALGGNVPVNADKNPQNQAKALYTQVSTQSTPPRQAGFADMNWYESLYYGLIPAALQNAAGQFVAPTQTSVDAALSDASVNSDGTLSFNYAEYHRHGCISRACRLLCRGVDRTPACRPGNRHQDGARQPPRGDRVARQVELAGRDAPSHEHAHHAGRGRGGKGHNVLASDQDRWWSTTQEGRRIRRVHIQVLRR